MSSKRFAEETIRPILSADKKESVSRVRTLYKQWLRHASYIQWMYRQNTLFTKEEVENKIRAEFRKNENITDLRAIDLLILQGRNDLRDVAGLLVMPCHVAGKWFGEQTIRERPSAFLDKFVQGSD